jgi:hypothetical protein
VVAVVYGSLDRAVEKCSRFARSMIFQPATVRSLVAAASIPSLNDM